MNHKPDKAIEIRKNGYKKFNELLIELVREFPEDVLYNY